MTGGARPGAGRPKGSRNQATLDRLAKIASEGITPLDYMLAIMRDANKADDLRFEAAKSAAPYVHAKLQTVDGNIGVEGGFTIVINKPE